MINCCILLVISVWIKYLLLNSFKFNFAVNVDSQRNAIQHTFSISHSITPRCLLHAQKSGDKAKAAFCKWHVFTRFQIRLQRTTLVVYCKKLVSMLQNRVLLLQEMLSYLVSCISSSATAQRSQHLPTDFWKSWKCCRGYDLKLWGKLLVSNKLQGGYICLLHQKI